MLLSSTCPLRSASASPASSLPALLLSGEVPSLPSAHMLHAINSSDIKWGSQVLDILEHPSVLVAGLVVVIIIALQVMLMLMVARASDASNQGPWGGLLACPLQWSQATLRLISNVTTRAGNDKQLYNFARGGLNAKRTLCPASCSAFELTQLPDVCCCFSSQCAELAQPILEQQPLLLLCAAAACRMCRLLLAC